MKLDCYFRYLDMEKDDVACGSRKHGRIESVLCSTAGLVKERSMRIAY
jgi:hypothetical protein